jgi:hypothetical protein
MGLQGHISIPSETLCAYLDLAEAAQSEISQEEGKGDPLRANVKKRKRAKTPPEELEPEREAEFQEEERVSKRTMRGDSDYSASSVSESDSDWSLERCQDMQCSCQNWLVPPRIPLWCGGYPL